LFVNDVIAKSLREKPVINLETALSPKRPELKSPKPESEGKLEKQAAEVGITRILKVV
jgi:hypothetical protein